MANPKKIPIEFDPAQLEKLQEPITVTVSRYVNGQEEPVALPVRPEEDVPGRGWTKDALLEMDGFLANKWVGAGSYKVVAVGANGEKMTWRPYFPESKYARLHEGVLIESPPAPAQQQFAGAQSSPGSWLSSMPSPTRQQPPWQQASPWQMQGGNGGSPPWAAPPSWTTPSAWSSQIRQPGLDSGVNQEREERLKLEAKIERERLENAYKERLSALSGEIADFKRQFSEQQHSAPNAEVTALKDQLRLVEQSRSDDKLVAMIREGQQQTREMIQASERQTREMIQSMQALVQQQLASRPVGPDPTMMMVVEAFKAQSIAQTESARAQADATKEAARMQAEAQREVSKNSLGPREMIDLMRSSSIGQEQLASAYSKVWELMQQGMETILSAQQPSASPALELVGQAAQGSLDVVRRYVAMKERAAVAQAQAQAATAQAQAQAAQHGSSSRPTLAGAEEEPEEEEEGGEEQAEEELFGPALPNVMELREAVEAGSVSPAQSAQAVVGGIDQLARAGVRVPVLDLWAQGRLSELCKCVLPDAKESYYEQMISELFSIRQSLAAQAQAAVQAQG